MRTIGIIVAVAIAGCGVSKDKFKKVQSQLDACEASRTDLEGQLAAANARIVDLDDRVARLTQTLEDSEIGKGQVEEELAGVLKDRARLAESAAELKAALADARKRKVEAEKRVAEFRDLLAKFKSLIDAGKLEVKIVDGRMVLALPTDVLFASGSASLSEEGKAAIAEVAGVLATIKGRRFQVEGHTDNVPIRSRKYPSNWELAADRAVTVARTMTEAGMPGGALSAASYGEFRPTEKNDTAEGREANRRIEIVLVPDLSSLPGFDELKSAVGET
jgi:chemotaxis protein MotB